MRGQQKWGLSCLQGQALQSMGGEDHQTPQELPSCARHKSRCWPGDALSRLPGGVLLLPASVPF